MSYLCLPGSVCNSMKSPVWQVDGSKRIHSSKIFEFFRHHPAFPQPFPGDFLAFLWVNFKRNQKFWTQLILISGSLHNFVGAAKCTGCCHALGWNPDFCSTTQTLKFFSFITPTMRCLRKIIQTEFKYLSLRTDDICLNFFLIAAMLTGQSGISYRVGCNCPTVWAFEFRYFNYFRFWLRWCINFKTW